MFQDLQTSTLRLTLAFGLENRQHLYVDAMVVGFRTLRRAFAAARLRW